MHVFDRIKVTIRFLVEANEHENAPFLEKDAWDYIQKIRQLQLQEGDAEAMQK